MADVIQQTRNFFKEVWEELHKVHWTSRAQLWQSTRVVILGAFFLAMYLYAIDALSAKVLQGWLLGMRQ